MKIIEKLNNLATFCKTEYLRNENDQMRNQGRGHKREGKVPVAVLQ